VKKAGDLKVVEYRAAGLSNCGENVGRSENDRVHQEVAELRDEKEEECSKVLPRRRLVPNKKRETKRKKKREQRHHETYCWRGEDKVQTKEGKAEGGPEKMEGSQIS